MKQLSCIHLMICDRKNVDRIMQELYLIYLYFLYIPICLFIMYIQNLIDAPIRATVITAPHKTKLRDMKRDVLHWLKS